MRYMVPCALGEQLRPTAITVCQTSMGFSMVGRREVEENSGQQFNGAILSSMHHGMHGEKHFLHFRASRGFGCNKALGQSVPTGLRLAVAAHSKLGTKWPSP